MKPQYLYRCMHGHETSQHHGMMESPIIVCQECGCRMHKVPQRVTVVWNGNPPGKGGIHPLVEQYNKNFPKQVDKFQEKKNAHLQRTISEQAAAKVPGSDLLTGATNRD